MRAGRQAHCKSRAFARLARHCHVAVHHACELAREGKAEPVAVAPRSELIGLGEFLNNFACCSAVRPMPVSSTASSTQSRPSATLRTRRVTSPSFVNLQAPNFLLAVRSTFKKSGLQAFLSQLTPDLARAVDAEVLLEHAPHLDLQGLIPFARSDSREGSSRLVTWSW